MTHRIMGWSGPRNISTAMMRAWENRADTEVWDEPFYAAWLKETGRDHPMRDEVLAAHDSDREAVEKACARGGPQGKPVFYQKQMAHHVPPEADLAFVRGAGHFFLIRDPRRVTASYAKKQENPSPEDLGVTRQRRLYDRIATLTGRDWPVIETDAFLADPEGGLRALCRELDVAFDPAMLRWPAGRRRSDGVWAAHWYDAVESSTGFGPASPEPAPMEKGLEAVAQACRADYEALKARALSF